MYGSIYNITCTFLVAFFWIGSGMLSNGRGAGHQMSVHKYMYMLGWRNGKPGPPWVIDFAANWPKSCSDLLCRKGIRVSILHSYRVLPQLSTLKKYVHGLTIHCISLLLQIWKVCSCTCTWSCSIRLHNGQHYLHKPHPLQVVQSCSWMCSQDSDGKAQGKMQYIGSLCAISFMESKNCSLKIPKTQYWLPLQRWVNFRMLSSRDWITEIFK